ncbi:MAG TPA: hypothetical protein VNO75_00710 [Gemmatimonadaceae bacterium]|nr:hypothetical protein [Gemmatimonadaceae bacterium]
MDLRSDLMRATLLGFVILGIGSRLLMRVVAIMQGATPGWSFGGTMTVVFLGTVSGFAAGVIYSLLRRFVREPWVRTALFIVICGVISWRGVHGVPPVQQAMFMALALAYLVIVDVLGRLASGARREQDLSFNLTG